MVMVAEDNPLNMEIIRRLLEKREITVIQEAVNGQEAVDAFRVSPEGSISAILMDIRMPVMNGLEAASAIRKMARKDATEVPIIALTANAYDEDRQKSLNAGMNEHLTKPLDPALLYSVLEKFICRQTE
jgi:CheY-like chemotaxis protein